jgi:Uma2 family endonuclease
MGEYQGEITVLLREKMHGGRSLPECPIQTTEGVKAVDVAWVSNERRSSRPNDPVYVIAPEICVQIVSPSNTDDELTSASVFTSKRVLPNFGFAA